MDLFLDWGADPLQVDVNELCATYDSQLCERFRLLGVDFTSGHALAHALGYHTSNKPLFGFAKRPGHAEAHDQGRGDLEPVSIRRMWDTTAMGKASALNLSELSRDEKLELIDWLWESLGQDSEALPLTNSQREELDRRLDELEAEGPTGLSWDEVVAQARARSR